ncbi:MAG: helix-turn-helix transcriptional regulator, partial [Paludibacter sp.]|nr:helix-turn-helix transcriptional regulator [Paludibacter sp.]
NKKEKILYLTPREKDILKLIADGCSYLEIAERFCISPESAKTYRRNLLLKFDAKNSITLVRMAIKQKLI